MSAELCLIFDHNLTKGQLVEIDVLLEKNAFRPLLLTSRKECGCPIFASSASGGEADWVFEKNYSLKEVRALCLQGDGESSFLELENRSKFLMDVSNDAVVLHCPSDWVAFLQCAAEQPSALNFTKDLAKILKSSAIIGVADNLTLASGAVELFWDGFPYNELLEYLQKYCGEPKDLDKIFRTGSFDDLRDDIEQLPELGRAKTIALFDKMSVKHEVSYFEGYFLLRP
ncbi:hypothetical protein IGB42_04312 [Andreprevotia sp. IGB-42]|uniref:hypothetical protein n=1 Tax=Andreprevotia sp. IGB-42 TaxID=2497473 RepID=UPI001357B215|nr:hypothetical protein [Andreprevotia sp. IGB-42]KAF0811224.1 hypothetical protein IGB42_04312 [Andreprevotia sp. IGB-42]